MKEKLDKTYEDCRVLLGPYASKKEDNLMGAFYIQSPITLDTLLVLSSGPDNGSWEHVSISVPEKDRTPTWEEMCFIKNIFWNKDELVIQFHPPEKDYVRIHPFVLHLWKPI